MSQTRERYFEWTLVGLILIMGGLLFYEGLPFLNGALGAITLYLLLRRVNLYLCTRFSRKYAPWVITLCVTIFVMVPLSALLWYIIDVVQNVDFDLSSIIKRFYDTLSYLESQTGLDIASDRTLAFLTTRATDIMNMLMSGINNTAINLFTAILLLFFLLSGGMKMERSIARCLPFSDANKRLIIAKISTIVRSNAIGIPLLAIIQGAVAALGYSLCGVNRPIEFGVLTGFASMIPIVGSMLVWVPLSILQYAEHAPNIMPALYLAGYGVLIISSCDNVLRMIMQKRMANTHPLITIFGVVAGLPLFGFMGLIFGPLLVAMFLLFLELFVNQYIIENKDPNQAIVSSPTRRSRRERQQQASGGLHALKERLTRHGPNHNVPSAPQPASAPAATAPAANATNAANAANAATAAQSAARPNLNLEPKAKSFKSAKAQSKQEKRAAAKQREALEQAQSQRAPEAAAPVATRSQQNSRQLNSEGSAARPERKPSAAAARSTKAETKSAASVGIKPEVKTAPSTKAPSKTQPAKTQPGTAQAPQPMPLSVVLTPPTSTPSDLTAFKDLGRSHTARALRRDQRFNLAPDALGREQASGQSLVARAVAQAIGSFDSFDDLEGTSAPATALAPRPLKRPEAPKPSAALSPDALPPAPKETNVSARAARLSRHERKQERTQRALSATSAAGDAARTPQAEAKPRPERAPSAPQAQAKEQVPKQEPKHAPKAARAQRAERSSTARPAARKLQGAPAGKGARASNKPSGRKSGASRRNGRNGRARNLDYQVLRPTHHPTNDLPLHTVVSRSAGFEPEHKRPTLRTQLVSVHTAKGTMLADPPRRRPSKRRPYH